MKKLFRAFKALERIAVLVFGILLLLFSLVLGIAEYFREFLEGEIPDPYDTEKADEYVRKYIIGQEEHKQASFKRRGRSRKINGDTRVSVDKEEGEGQPTHQSVN